MKFNLSNEREVNECIQYLDKLTDKKVRVEIREVKPIRTLSQNRFAHLLFGYFGQHFGYSIEEAKLIYKEINKSIYYYEKKGRTFIRSSADLTTEEMSKSIDRFREKSAEAGFPLPAAYDVQWLEQIEREIERSKWWL